MIITPSCLGEPPQWSWTKSESRFGHLVIIQRGVTQSVRNTIQQYFTFGAQYDSAKDLLQCI